MAIRRLNYLIRRGECLYFRRAIPLSLIKSFGRREIKVSLGTSDPREGRRRCRGLTIAFENVVEAVELMPELDRDTIDSMLRRYYADCIGEVTEIVEMSIGGTNPGLKVEEELGLAEQDLQEVRQQVANRIYSKEVRITASDLLSDQGCEAPAKASKEWDYLCHGILRARAEQRRAYIEMLRGRYDRVSPQDALFLSAASEQVGPNKDQSKTPTIVEMAERYIEFKSAGDWAKKTIQDNLRVLNWFQETVGTEKQFGMLATSDISAFRAVLMGIPKNMAKAKAYNGMTLNETIASASDAEKLSLKTVKKYFVMMKGFIDWCCDELDIPTPPGSKIKVSHKSNPQEARLSFNKTQLKGIFGSPLYRGCKSAARRTVPGSMVYRDGKFWIPLISLFSGMRMGEIIQLGIEDLREESELWIFDINTESSDGSSKGLKTKQSKRKVPVHSELIKIGLLAYLEERIENPGDDLRLFPDVKQGSKGDISQYFSKWFGRFLKDIGVKTPKTTFHSFRHGFKDALNEAGVEDTRQYSLLGHKDKSVSSSVVIQT